jgi:hypothetical protein
LPNAADYQTLRSVKICQGVIQAIEERIRVS